MVSILRSGFLGFALLALGACATASERYSDRPSVDYGLGVGDIVRVIVFGEADLSGDYVVDKDGTIAFPLLGNIDAQGQSLSAVQMAISQELQKTYFDLPRVTVEVVDYRPVFIYGEVNAPGKFPYTDGLTALQAVATAGGFTYRANKAVILIQAEKTDEEIPYSLSPRTKLRPGDTVRVIERGFF
ncbi:MAG: polysaccharide biosynthesis/export family protein [Pseudomonadota bacterium]